MQTSQNLLKLAHPSTGYIEISKHHPLQVERCFKEVRGMGIGMEGIRESNNVALAKRHRFISTSIFGLIIHYFRVATTLRTGFYIRTDRPKPR